MLARPSETLGGDEFMRLAREHEAALSRVALRLSGGDRDLAADCLQDALVAGFQAFAEGRLADPSGFRPWMMRILANKFHREWRRMRRVAPSDRANELAEARQADQEEPALPMSEVQAAQLRAALAALPAGQRDCVMLVDVDGLSYEEAAASLGLPVGTVRSRLSRARWQLAARLTAEGGWE
jgi:RNA polymerase sigma-70 factor (ECF subfamily)